MNRDSIRKGAALHAPLFLRALVALVFLVAGASKLLASAETARLLAEHGVPSPTVAGAAIGAFEMIAGTLLLLGRFTRVVAVVLVAHVALLSLVFHLPFGLSPGAAHAQWVQIAFDLLAVGALYAVARQRPLASTSSSLPSSAAS